MREKGMMRIIVAIIALLYRIGESLLFGASPGKMNYSCGKKVVFGFQLMLAGVLTMRCMVPVASMIGKIGFYVGMALYIITPIYYNLLLRKNLSVIYGNCSGYIIKSDEICGFVISTEMGDIPIVGRKFIPVVGQTGKVFLKVSHNPLIKTSVYSFELLKRSKKKSDSEEMQEK